MYAEFASTTLLRPPNADRSAAAVPEGCGEPGAAYQAIACIGAGAAARLAATFPTPDALRRALPGSLTTIAAMAGVPEAIIARWWPGALAWLAAGRDAEIINLYQAAGYADARAVAEVADLQVLWRLGTIASLDPSLQIPLVGERIRMAAAPGVRGSPGDRPGHGRRLCVDISADLWRRLRRHRSNRRGPFSPATPADRAQR